MSETKTVNATEKKSNRSDLLLRAASAALLVVATIICAGVTVYWKNADGFEFELSALVLPMIIGGGALFLFLFVLQFPFIKNLYSCITTYLVFCTGVCLYFQSNWFLWNLGELVNGEFWWDWKSHGVITIVEAILYLLLFIVLIWQRKFLFNNITKISLLIIAVELLSTFPITLTTKPDCSYKHYVVDDSNRFVFSQNQNIILCIFDCYSTTLLKEIIKENPEINNLLKDFTFYTHLFGEYSQTKQAVPGILTGVYGPKTYNNQLLYDYYHDPEKSVLLKLSRQNVKVEIYPWGTINKSVIYFDKDYIHNIQDTVNNQLSSVTIESFETFCYMVTLRITPLRVKSLFSRSVFNGIHNIVTYFDIKNKAFYSNICFYDNLKKSKVDQNNQIIFKYYHLSGVHRPFSHDENLNPVTDVGLLPSKKMYYNQGKGVILIIEEFINQLKSLNIYDNSMIIFMGDHGRYDNECGFMSEIPGELNPMLLIKMPMEKHKEMRINDSVILETDLCQAPVWKDISSAFPDATLDSLFSEEDKAKRTAIWNSHLENSFKKQYSKFKKQLSRYNFSDPINCSFNTPRIEDKELIGLLRLDRNYGLVNNNVELMLVSDDTVYSAALQNTNWAVMYDCDMADIQDGKYRIYYSLNTTNGVKIHYCENYYIVVKNGIMELVSQ